MAEPIEITVPMIEAAVGELRDHFEEYDRLSNAWQCRIAADVLKAAFAANAQSAPLQPIVIANGLS